MVNLIASNFVTGYLTWQGSVFCSHPRLIYFAGSVGVACWCAACLTCVLLAFNRCVDFTRADLANTMFAGNKTWLWLLLPAVYFLAIFVFETPVIYDSNYVSWFYDPFISAPVHYNFNYSNTTHVINNIAVIFILCAENAYLCHNIFKLSGNLSSSVKRKRQSFSLYTNPDYMLPGVLASAVYVYMNYFYVPPWLILAGSLAYSANCGSPAFIYLILNKNLRRASFRLFSEKSYKASHRSAASVSIKVCD
uniref:Serpentine receptor class gamma n=1 Tax=Ditylenchus dipsaci TaxID=166011 RepID=A0A915DR99_9BILA